MFGVRLCVGSMVSGYAFFGWRVVNRQIGFQSHKENHYFNKRQHALPQPHTHSRLIVCHLFWFFLSLFLFDEKTNKNRARR